MGEQLKAYYRLTKPGIVYGNLMTAAAGFLLASRWHINAGRLAAMLVGLGLIIAAACVFNNVLDRDLDARMARTRRRALVTGLITPATALPYATLLALAGTLLLAAFTNGLTLTLALASLIGYVAVYGAAKRLTTAGTLIGSLPGAVPPAAGYTAVTGRFDLGALLLFVILVIWQMPHFYSIALYRLSDYTAAGLPVLPAKRGPATTKRRILAYIAAFTIIAPLLTIFSYTNIIYLIFMLTFGLAWLTLGLTRYNKLGDETWGRTMFRFSLIVLLSFSILAASAPH